MARLFTLRYPLIGTSVLNGKVFTISIHHESRKLRFFDASMPGHSKKDTILWETTTSVVEETETDDGLHFTTESGSIYNLVDVSTLIPTVPVLDRGRQILQARVGHIDKPRLLSSVLSPVEKEQFFDIMATRYSVLKNLTVERNNEFIVLPDYSVLWTACPIVNTPHTITEGFSAEVYTIIGQNSLDNDASKGGHKAALNKMEQELQKD